MTTSTLQGACSISAPEIEPRHQRPAQLSRCLWPTMIRSAADLARVLGDFLDGFAGDHLAAGRPAGFLQPAQAVLEHAAVLLLLALFQFDVVDAALEADEAHGRRHDGHQVQFRLAPDGQLLAVQQGLLAGFGAVIGDQDLLVHRRAPKTCRGRVARGCASIVRKARFPQSRIWAFSLRRRRQQAISPGRRPGLEVLLDASPPARRTPSPATAPPRRTAPCSTAASSNSPWT
jgi:hypothetical protein